MKKLTQIAAIFILLALLLVISPFTPVMAQPTLILNPGFETVAQWTFSETDPDLLGDYSANWTTQGTYSYRFWTAGNIGLDDYCQILQSADFTSIDTLSFDAQLSAITAGEFEARVIVGAATVWSQACPTSPTEYLHQEVDVSGYTGPLDLIFQIYAIINPGDDMTNDFDNIKTWGSYSGSGRTNVANNFATFGDLVYMYGENFDTNGTYKVAYYDGGTAHDGADGAKLQVNVYTDDADGILDESQCRPADYPTSSYGPWHAVVYKTTETMPNSYNLVIKTDAAYVVTDSFTVQQEAIPEFPTVFAAIAVAGLCFGIYYWMRKRRLAYVKA